MIGLKKLKKHSGKLFLRVDWPMSIYVCRKAGKPEAAAKVLEQLTHNAVVERRYKGTFQSVSYK